MNIVLSTDNLAIGYKGKALVSNINLELKVGEVTAIIGRNGAGKSTLLKTISGIIKPINGDIWINGQQLIRFSRKDLASKLAVVMQEPHFAGGLTLEEFVSLGRTPYSGRLGRLDKRDELIVTEALESVGLFHKKNNFIVELSDGERQKGIIARGIVQQTKIIMMDEPFSFLDISARIELNLLLRRIARTQNRAILLSTHEISDALSYANNIWMFTTRGVIQGNPTDLIQAGSLDSLFSDPRIRFNKDIKRFEWKFT